MTSGSLQSFWAPRCQAGTTEALCLVDSVTKGRIPAVRGKLFWDNSGAFRSKGHLTCLVLSIVGGAPLLLLF